MKQLAVPFLALFLFASCATITGDPAVVTAERTTQIAADTFDSFLRIEYTNREFLKQWPEIHAYAETIRHNGQRWLMTARALTQSYKANRSAQNKANLQTALAVLESAISQTQGYLTLANTATP